MAAALGGAVYGDPAAAWVVPDDALRRELLERAFKLFLDRIWIEQDECYTTEQGVGAAVWELPGQWKLGVGGAVWERPGQWKLGVGAQLRLLPRLALTYRRHTPRLVQAINALESNHPSEEHYYLAFVGVTPERQGPGPGAALLQ